MVNLHRLLASPRICVLLANRSGNILDTVDELEASTDPLEHWPLTHELRSLGTPAIPPALPDTPRQHTNHAFGIAAPINAASGGLLGIVDRSGNPAWGMQHANALLQLTAELIERRVVETDERGFLLVRFHTRADLLDGPMDAIALFDQESRLIAYNRLASNLLSLRRDGLHATCDECFDTHWPGLVGVAAMNKPAPVVLRMQNGKSVLAFPRLCRFS